MLTTTRAMVRARRFERLKGDVRVKLMVWEHKRAAALKEEEER